MKQRYLDWINRRLPAGLPPSARREALGECRARLDSSFWARLAAQYEARPFLPEDEETIRFSLFRAACQRAAEQVSAMEGSAETDRWRYLDWGLKDGKRWFKENLSYEFDAVYDRRKVWFEMQLQLERTTLPFDWVERQAERYEEQMNLRFTAPHWRWDPDTFTFLEISHSRQADAQGIPHPNDADRIELTDRYAR